MSEQPQPEWGLKLSKYICIPQRVIIAIMCILAVVNSYTTRQVFPIAITKMVVVHHHAVQKSKEIVCKVEENKTDDTSIHGDYDWSQEMQGFMLGAFYIGYLITHVPAGMLAERYGAKWVLGLGVFFSSIFTFVTPALTKIGGAAAMICLRIMMGLAQGTLFPGMTVLLSCWVPKKERGTLSSCVLGAGQIGTIIANSISGQILAKHKWQVVYYIFATCALIWFIFFILMCFSDPSEHPYIKPSERAYIHEEMGRTGRRHDLPPVPWRDILTSVPVWAMIMAYFGQSWSYFLIATYLPKYLNDVIMMPIKKNGYLSSLPFLCMWIMSLIAGVTADFLINRKILSLSVTRKLWTHLSLIGRAVFLISASYAECNEALVMTFFTLCAIMIAFFYSGAKLAPMDMSPNYTGTLMGLANGFGAISGFLSSYTGGLITEDALMWQWRVVWWISVGIAVFSSLMFGFCSSSETQPWNEGSVQGEKKEDAE